MDWEGGGGGLNGAGPPCVNTHTLRFASKDMAKSYFRVIHLSDNSTCVTGMQSYARRRLIPPRMDGLDK